MMVPIASLLPLLVLGHGAYPLAYQMVERPGSPTHLAAGTSFGLVLSDDDGASWTWVCEEAIGYGTGLTPVWYVSPDGALFGAGFKGMFVSRDHGCTWIAAPEFADAGASDIADNGTALFATSQKYGSQNGVWRSSDNGMVWAPLSVSSDAEFYTSVRFAPSRPQRLYVGEWWFMPSPTEALYWSDNGGDSFTRVDVTQTLPPVPQPDGGMAPVGGAFYVRAVGATDPDLIYAVVVLSDGSNTCFVIRSPDRGQTWSLLLKTADLVGSMAVSPDGKTIYVGTAMKLYVSTNSGASFTPLDRPTKQSCADLYGDHLYACGWPELDGYGVGRASGGSMDFQPFLTWARITGAASCDATTAVGSTCPGLFNALLATFPPGTVGDAGDGSDGGMTGSPNPGCHCAHADAPALLGLVLIIRAVRRRRHAARD
jgi:photosystem II stability/assembly factor-like uncharacterized protein